MSADPIEVEARRLLRETITRLPWFRHGLSDRARAERIEREVDVWWHLKADEAARLVAEQTSREGGR